MKKLFMFMFVLAIFSIAAFGQVEDVIDDIKPLRDLSWLWPVISAALVGITAFFKVNATKWKSKAGKFVTFGIEATDVLVAGTTLADTSLKAAADNVFTVEEKADIKTKAENWTLQKEEMIAAWKTLIAKEAVT